MDRFDAVVVGGGPVGRYAALAAAHAGLSVAQFEARPRGNDAGDRTLALSLGSRLLLDAAGLGAALDAASTPIDAIHVSQRGRFGRTVMRAADAGLPALGYVAGYRELLAALEPALPAAGVRTTWDAPVTGAVREADTWRVETGAGPVACAALLIADGGGQLPGRLGFETRTRDYRTSALVARVETDRHPAGTAWERFAAAGPLALLPRGPGFALVWVEAPARAAELASLPEAKFLAALQDAFGWRAGRFTAVAERAAWPLALRTAQPRAREGVLLLGNAAQTLHPVAGQGLNLGLRDAHEGVDMLLREGAGALARFEKRRRADRAATISFTDALVRLFTADWPLLPALRGAGLTALDLAAPLRGGFARTVSLGSG
jgi:2-octaprenyl-6-methoxyphenol hydroxylase